MGYHYTGCIGHADDAWESTEQHIVHELTVSDSLTHRLTATQQFYTFVCLQIQQHHYCKIWCGVII